jgi:hypothetical protein
MPPHAQRGLGSWKSESARKPKGCVKVMGGENHSVRRLAVQGNAMRHQRSVRRLPQRALRVSALSVQCIARAGVSTQNHKKNRNPTKNCKVTEVTVAVSV